MAAGTSAMELRELADEELVSRLREAMPVLFNLRVQAATGQLDSHGRFFFNDTATTEIYTVMRERELGLSAAPEPVAEVA